MNKKLKDDWNNVLKGLGGKRDVHRIENESKISIL